MSAQDPGAATEPERRCGHCGRVQDGYAAVGNTPLCHPDTGMDCYKLVTLYSHATPCLSCYDPDPAS